MLTSCLNKNQHIKSLSLVYQLKVYKMVKLNPKVTEYIAKSADFAKPILNHLREIILTACPDAEEEYKMGYASLFLQGRPLGYDGWIQKSLFI